MATTPNLHTKTAVRYRSPLIHSVGGGVREGRRREADLGVRDVEDVVEPLQERVAVDEVEALTRVAAKVADDEVHVAGGAADKRVERALDTPSSATCAINNR